MIVNTVGPDDARIMLVGEAPGCFTDDTLTEVLTREGWIPIQHCTCNNSVAQYDKLTGEISFVNPIATTHTTYTGEVVDLNGPITTSVTPNHRFLLYNRYHEDFIVEEASELRLKYAEQAVVLSGMKRTGVELNYRLVQLLVAVQADGSYDETGIRFEFTKQRKSIRLLQILDDLNVEYRIGAPNTKGSFRLTIPKASSACKLVQLLLPSKVFEPNLLDFSSKSMEVFLDELEHWDGNRDTRAGSNYFEYSSSILQNVDIIQAIAHMCNRKAVLNKHGSVWRITVSNKTKAQITGVRRSTREYSGWVHCLTVPTGFFVVRCHNKIFITGNSEEDKIGKPFVGRAGKTLDNLLAQAGIARYQCLITNVARERPPGNRISYYFMDRGCTIPKPQLEKWIDQLKKDIEFYRPNIIVALGATALWALTGEKKISEFRGYIMESTLVEGMKVIPTYHPQAVNHEWKLYFPTVLDLRKALRHSKTPDIQNAEQFFVPNADVRTFVNYMNEIMEHPEWDKIAVDIETVQPGSHVEELGISHDPNFGMSIFFLKGRTAALPEKDELLVWQTFAKLVSMKKIVMQNGAYDTGVLWYNNHILIENLAMDTLIAAHVCWPELPRDLGFLGSICLNVAPWKNSSKSSVYNPADAANTLGIAEVLETELDRQNVRPTFDFEMSLIPIALMMQLRGIPVDPDTQKELIKKWSELRDQMDQQLLTVLGKRVNFNSSKQMQQLLYIDLKLPVQYKRRKSKEDTRTMTTDAAALRTLARLVPNNPIFNLILEYKKANTLINNFLEIELSPNNTVHTSYNITGASSDDEEDTKKTKRSFGRWSSSKSIIIPYGSGNLQNIPPEARKMYKAPKGFKIIEADYSQAEAVAVAHLIGDHKLIKMFDDSFGLSKTEKAAYDIHKLTYAQIAGISMDEVTKEQRSIGKTLRHGTNYSAGPTVVANRLGVTLAKAKEYIEMYHRANPALRMWHVQIQEELKRTRTLTNLLGRKHRFLDRWGDSLFRSAYSFIPQSTIGDLLNLALSRFYNALPSFPFDVTPILQLHDAMYNLVKEEYVMDAIKEIRKYMLIPLYYNNREFTIDVDFKVKDSWADGEELDINWREYDEQTKAERLYHNSNNRLYNR